MQGDEKKVEEKVEVPVAEVSRPEGTAKPSKKKSKLPLLLGLFGVLLIICFGMVAWNMRPHKLTYDSNSKMAKALDGDEEISKNNKDTSEPIITPPIDDRIQPVKSSISWYQPEKIISLKLCLSESNNENAIKEYSAKNVTALEPFCTADYYKVGKFDDGKYSGGEVILMRLISDPKPGWNFAVKWYRFAKDGEKLVLLAKASDEYTYEGGQSEPLDMSKLTIDKESDIPELQNPTYLYGSDKNQILIFENTGSALFDPSYVSKLFTDRIVGEVFTTKSEKSLNLTNYGKLGYDPINRSDQLLTNVYFVKKADGTFSKYVDFLQFAIYDSKDKEYKGMKINMIDKSPIAFGYQPDVIIGGCIGTNSIGMHLSKVVLKDNNESNLKVIGKTISGENLYTFKESNKFKEYFIAKYDYSGEKKNLEEFILDNPLFIWKDPFGRFTLFFNQKYFGTPQCSGPVAL